MKTHLLFKGKYPFYADLMFYFLDSAALLSLNGQIYLFGKSKPVKYKVSHTVIEAIIVSEHSLYLTFFNYKMHQHILTQKFLKLVAKVENLDKD